MDIMMQIHRLTGSFRALTAGLVLLAAAAASFSPLHAQPAATPGVTLPDFSVLAEQVGPSVVNIRTAERVTSRPGPQGGMPDEEMQEFFRRFFGIPFPGAPRGDGPRGEGRGQGPEREQTRGVGSGFIVSPDGYIMTNAHVVESADEVYVTLTDKREFRAKIVGSDRRTDVALVKVEATGLPAVRIGDVNRLKVGEWVMAIGSPFGLENTVTAGIVSAKGRDTGDYLPFIQTDVAINPGNSGGPLLNLKGEVVGINSQIYSRSGGFMGISFAIPIDEAQRVAEQLRTIKRMVRGRIGVQIDQVSKEVAESIGLGQPRGAIVRGVEAGGPADKAGVEAGDIIVRFDGREIERASDLPRIVGRTNPGSQASVQLFRRGQTRDLTVTVGEFEPEAPVRVGQRDAPRPSAGVSAKVLGLTVTDLTAAQLRDLKLRGGIRVTAVEGPAARAGLREGDVIVALANEEIADVASFERVVSALDRQRAVNVLIRRGDWAQYVVIRPNP